VPVLNLQVAEKEHRNTICVPGIFNPDFKVTILFSIQKLENGTR